ncbi:precorrin-6y C5,15-methyltransferase (decarboxylating) subunit CbiE [Nakamurella silvestris]|nr:precorrin-6y C5,15-methyltransferase (decarboxylating) subunit CbiE [Nakamurella silvestris]
MPTAVIVLGVGGDGWTGLTEAHQALVTTAEVVLAGARHLSLIPEVPGQLRLTWPSPLRSGLPDLLAELAGRFVLVLASGDPLVSGIGSTLIELLGPDRVTVLPHVSSVAVARARLGWPAESATVVSAVGRDSAAVLRPVAPGRRLLVLSSDEHTPGEVAALLTGAGYGSSTMTVFSDLDSLVETRVRGAAREFTEPVGRLNIIAVECVADPGLPVFGLVGGLPDEIFDHDGQLTKRDARASALSRLVPVPGQLLWDVGAGAGSVAVEWARADPLCRAIAIERDRPRAARIAANARRLGVPSLRVVLGAAPDALADLPAPDAVFIGGGATIPGLIDRCWSALAPGGRLVAHAVTVESEMVLLDRYRLLGGELTRIAIEKAEPLGTFTGWKPLRTLVQWSVQK